MLISPKIVAFVAFFLAVATLSLVKASEVAEKPLVLVDHGQPWCVVTLGSHPSPAATQAAETFVDVMKQMTGATIPVVEAPPQGNDLEHLVIVYIGDTPESQQRGVDLSKMGPESVAIQTGPGFLILAGSDKTKLGTMTKGTQWAVYTFLENLGVQWLWPGELGTAVPKMDTVTVAPTSYRYEPKVPQRVIRNLFYNERVQKGVDELGWTKDDYLKWGQKDAAAWFEHQKCGSSLTLNYGHAFGQWWEKYGQAHPDWFALQPNGSRDQARAFGPDNDPAKNPTTAPTTAPTKIDRARLCMSNPEVIQQAAQQAIEYFNKNPSAMMASMSDNDGGQTVFCTCDNCKAWDVPERGTVKWGKFTVPVMSDREFRFTAEVAKIVAKKYPDKLLGVYAYGAYLQPPVRIDRLPDNVWVGFVGFHGDEALALWNEWTRKTDNLFLRPNGLTYGAKAFPVAVGPHAVAERLKYYLKTGLKAADIDDVYHTWGIQGIDEYVATKILWDPSADVDKLIDTYIKAGFGDAAPEVRGLIDDIEKNTTAAIATARAKTSARSGMNGATNEGDGQTYAEMFPDETFKRWDAYLDRADRLTQDDTVHQRIALWRLKLQQGREEVIWHDAGNAFKAKQITKEQYDAAKQRIVDFYKKAGMTWAFPSAYQRYYNR